jgi:hypothetical protein
MFADFYKRFLEGAIVSGNLVTGLCPFHEDGKQSFSAYVDTGTWACFGSCQLKGRPPEEFVARKMGFTLEESLKYLSDEGLVAKESKKRSKEEAEPSEPALVSETLIQEKHEALLQREALLEELLLRRGWTKEIVEEFKLGWDEQDDRVWIPVMDARGVVNVRRYDWHHKTKNKFLNFAQGYGKNRVWPRPPVASEDVILVEGEPDALMLRSYGFNAFSFTGGASNPLVIHARRISILYDADEAGKAGAQKALDLLKSKCDSVKLVFLPEWPDMPPNADVTDWFMKGGGGTAEALKHLIDEAHKAPEIPLVTLPEAIWQENSGRTMKVQAVASGKNLSPFQVPKLGVVVCSQGIKACQACGIADSGGHHGFEIRLDSQKLIECSGETSTKVRHVLREHLGIPVACTVHEIEVTQVQNLYDVKLTSMVDMQQPSEKTPYIAIQAWATRDIDLNTPFVLTAKAMPDPKTQAGTLIITDIASNQTTIDGFALTAEQRTALEIFRG